MNVNLTLPTIGAACTSSMLLRALAVMLALAVGGCAATPTVSDLDQAALREARTLETRPTAENLATAAVLLRIDKDAPGEPTHRLELLQRAEALQPQRPELAWLQMTECLRANCATQAAISRLQAIDPGNGFVWLDDLRRAEAAGDDAPITQAVEHIGSSVRMTFYWNQLLVMMTDALAAADPSASTSQHFTEVVGFLAATAIPPLQPISKACNPDHFDLPARRTACEQLAARMERSDSVLTQGLAFGMELRWWTAGDPRREVVLKKRRQLDYLLWASNGSDRQSARIESLSIDAARSSEREEDIVRAVVGGLGHPLSPPADWKDAWRHD